MKAADFARDLSNILVAAADPEIPAWRRKKNLEWAAAVCVMVKEEIEKERDNG